MHRPVQLTVCCLSRVELGEPQERGRVLSRWSGLIRENSNDLATIMCVESGKPKAESKGEVNYAVSFIDMYASMQTNGLVLPAQTDTHLVLATKEVIRLDI